MQWNVDRPAAFDGPVVVPGHSAGCRHRVLAQPKFEASVMELLAGRAERARRSSIRVIQQPHRRRHLGMIRVRGYLGLMRTPMREPNGLSLEPRGRRLREGSWTKRSSELRTVVPNRDEIRAGRERSAPSESRAERLLVPFAHGRAQSTEQAQSTERR